MKDYFVQVDYRSWTGNCLTKTATIKAESHEKAMNFLIEKVRGYKRTMKIDGGSAVENTHPFTNH